MRSELRKVLARVRPPAPPAMPPPMSALEYDRAYRDGKWDVLYSMAEIAHYMVVVGYASYAPESRTILDVGCGHGRLLQLLDQLGFSRYMGIDFSVGALERADALGIADARFELADFDRWDTDERFDVVVFNECLSNSTDPAVVVGRAIGWTAPGGLLIASVHRYGDITRVWSAFESRPDLELLAADTIRNAVGYVWDVKAFRPRDPATGPTTDGAGRA
jgi:SAM-dependent methyltransferase